LPYDWNSPGDGHADRQQKDASSWHNLTRSLVVAAPTHEAGLQLEALFAAVDGVLPTAAEKGAAEAAAAAAAQAHLTASSEQADWMTCRLSKVRHKHFTRSTFATYPLLLCCACY